MHTMNRTFQSLVFLAFLWIGFSCSEDKGMMLRQLEALEQANRDDSLMTNDSLAETLVAYFDKHGSANERMRARYMLGRTYADIGETPKAISVFNDVEMCVDMSDNDCDFHTLSRIHGQKAAIFRKQYMPQEAALEFDKAIMCSLKNRDSLSALIYQENKLVTYYQLYQYDSLLYYTDIVYNAFIKNNLYSNAANCLGSSIFVLLEKQELAKAKEYIDFYDRYCEIDKDPKNRYASLLSYRGTYYLQSGNPDSAIYYFRKQLKYKEILNNRVQAYHGLLTAFQQKKQNDSTAKYAELYCIANDSSNVFDSANRLQTIQSLYRYERSQNAASLNREKAESNRRLMWMAIVLSLMILLVVVQYFRKLQLEENTRLAKLNNQYFTVLEKYERAKRDLIFAEQTKEEFIQQKEAEISEYKRILQKYENFSRDSNVQDFVLSENPLLIRLHKLASSGKSLSDDELKEVFSLIERIYPNFFEELEAKLSRMTHKQKSLCALTKLYFIPSEIGSLLNMRYQAVSNMRSRLVKCLWGDDCETETFDVKIHEIC